MRRLACPAATIGLLLALGATSASAAPPAIPLSTFSHVTTDSATIEADLSPGGKATVFYFEYGPADCDSNPCTFTPNGELSPKSPLTRVKAQLEGLSPGTTYHFRLVAQNGEGTTEGPDRTFTTYFPPQVFDPCPNDALRNGKPSASLPDCRAYEQASPVDKNAQDVRGMVAWVKASANGDAVSFLTPTGMTNGEGAQDFPVYLSSRAGEWSTQGLQPPAAIGEEAFILGWLPDFSQVFSSARRFGVFGNSTLLSRSSATGAHTTLVPFGSGLTGTSFAGASAGGSVVVFESNGKLLGTNAIEGKSNVYAWDRTSGEVSLASALNDGNAPSAGAFAGPYNWIEGETPTTLAQGGAERLYSTQDQHAIASDGSVYFTAAETGQLYLRMNPTEPQSAVNGEDKCTEPTKACTIHVSASQRTAPDPLGERPAVFHAATPDGSKAFFTSPEELTDDANTGPPPPGAPSIARADIDGDPESVELEFLPAEATGIAVDDEHIYWASPKEGAIGRAKLNGDGPFSGIEEDFITGAGVPQYVAVDGEYVYWTNAADGGEGNGTIGRAELDGDNPKLDFITGAFNPKGIAVDAEHIYWGNAHNEGFSSGSIGRANLDGSNTTPDFIQQVFGGTIQGIAVNASYVFSAINQAANGGFGYVWRYELDGSSTSGLGVEGTQPHSYRGLAVDAGHIYVARQGENAIGRSSLTDFPPCCVAPPKEPKFIKSAGRPLGVAVDNEHIYWAANQEVVPNPGNDLYRYDLASSDLTDLTPNPSEANGADVQGVLGTSEDGSHVYFAANGVLAPGAVPGDCESSANASTGLDGSGTCSLYLAHEGTIEFIARLDVGFNGSSLKGRDSVNWVPYGAINVGQLEKTARVSAAGNALLFSSQEKLTAYDNEGSPVLYRYDAVQDEVTCVSCNPTGAAPGVATRGISVAELLPNGTPASVLSRSLSADGNRVFFESTDPLVVGDTNGEADCPLVGSSKNAFPACQDVYMWEAKGTGSCEEDIQGGGCLYLLSTGKSSEPSFFADASATGGDAFLITRSQLVGQDGDELYDAYDARVEGGLASQNQLAPLPCESEACKGSASALPASQTPGTSTFSGPGNPKAGKPRPRCPKGKRQARRRGKARCVPKRGQKRSQSRDAKTTGRRSR